MLASAVAGLASAGVGSGAPATALIALAAASVAAALASVRAPALGLACGALLLAGAAGGAGRVAEIDAPAGALAEGLRVEAEAVLLEPPRPSPFGSSAEIELMGGPADGARLLARAGRDVRWPDDAPSGSILAVTGSARSPEPGDEGAFDWSAHLRRRGVAGELDLESVRATGATRGGLPGALDRARTHAEDALRAGLGESRAALIRGMVLGQDEAIDPLVRDDFRAAGLAHILAVSGQNVLLLGMLALPVLSAAGLGPRGRAAALSALIALYVPLAGAGPSLQRAGAMGAAALAALALGRPASRWYGLLVAAAATLALNPRACGDPGWQLSFAAVAGILLLGPTLRAALSELPRLLAEGVTVTVAATVATAPLLAHHFDQVSLASLPANLLALPAVAAAMWIGMVQIGLGQLVGVGEPLAAIGTAAATALGAVNGLILGYIGELARRFAELPWAEVEAGLASPLEVAGMYGLIVLLAVWARGTARRFGPAATALWGSLRTAPRRTRASLAVLLAGGILLVVAEAVDAPEPPEHLAVSFLDVGQGDATLVRHPAGGTILIDGGPEEARVYRLLREAGVESLDLVVATHAAADHHGGLEEVLERMPVGLLLEGGDRTSDPSFRALLAEADRRGVRRLTARAGQVLRVGGLTVEVLWPEPRPPGPPPEDPNLRAVTTLVSAGEFELLASGDAESPSLLPLELPDVDVLKVPHHGSEDRGLPEALDRLAPQVAGIGVGEDNGYGHPTASTLEALRDAGADVYRTDLHGTVTVSVEDGRMHVTTER